MLSSTAFGHANIENSKRIGGRRHAARWHGILAESGPDRAPRQPANCTGALGLLLRVADEKQRADPLSALEARPDPEKRGTIEHGLTGLERPWTLAPLVISTEVGWWRFAVLKRGREPTSNTSGVS